MATREENLSEAKAGQGQLAFLAALPGVAVYPFKGLGWAAVVAGAVFFYVLNLIARFSVLGWILSLAVGGYLAAFMIRILGASAAGEDAVPDWPNPSGFWDDLLRPFLLLVAAGLISFLPLVVYVAIWYRDWPDMAFSWRLVFGLLALGVLYLPMALIAAALYESFEALNPVRVFGGIVKTMPVYLVATATLGGVFVLEAVAETYLSDSVPVLGPLAAGALSLYAIMVEMRILGLLYLTHRKRLGWFE